MSDMTSLLKRSKTWLLRVGKFALKFRMFGINNSAFKFFHGKFLSFIGLGSLRRHLNQLHDPCTGSDLISTDAQKSKNQKTEKFIRNGWRF